MQEYFLRRLLMLAPVMFLVSIMVFSIIRLVPGDVVELMLVESGNVRNMELAREQLGLTKPFHEQYLIWLWGVARGEFGNSLWTGRPVRDEILKRLPVTLELATLAMLISLCIAIPVGIISAIRQDTWPDYAGRLVSIGGLSVPDFWIATLIIGFSSLWFHWMPRPGYIPLFQDPGTNLQQFILPALAMGAALSASVMRMTRSQMLEVLRQDYIRTAWAKGLRERSVIIRHALKNAMIPVITIMGVQFGYLMGGTVVMEVIFSLPGLGKSTLDAIFQRDYPQLQANVLLAALVMVTVNLLVDLFYAWFDPRIRYR
ncbi:MAG: ABC transporter permease [Chloroflexi bacterium]|nr:ABC transporter permease [Chloroflexota bacterium]